MPLNPLNHHYSMENPASVYDEEAMTALELAGRTTAKVNETVKAFNELEANTNDHLENQDKNIEHIRKVTVPQDIKDECQRLIEAGEFDQAINLYMNNLNGRLDNLLGQVVPGGTSMDAEVVDARVGANGVTYNDVGTALRTQLQDYCQLINHGVNKIINTGYESYLNVELNNGTITAKYTKPADYTPSYAGVGFTLGKKVAQMAGKRIIVLAPDAESNLGVSLSDNAYQWANVYAFKRNGYKEYYLDVTADMADRLGSNNVYLTFNPGQNISWEFTATPYIINTNTVGTNMANNAYYAHYTNTDIHVTSADMATRAGYQYVKNPNTFKEIIRCSGSFTVEENRFTLTTGEVTDTSNPHYVAGSIAIPSAIRGKLKYILLEGDEPTNKCLTRIGGNWSNLIGNIKMGVNDVTALNLANESLVYLTFGDYNVSAGTTKTIRYYLISEDNEVIATSYLWDKVLNTEHIVCWGDSLTAGGGWPSRLSKLSGHPYINCGVGGETSMTISARQGGDVMLVNNITIPADKTAVQVATTGDGTFITAMGKKSRPLLQGGSETINPVMIAGIKGTLKLSGDVYTFTRSTEGEAVVINRPTAVVTKADREYNNPHLMVIFMGQNGGYGTDLNILVNQHRWMIDHAKAKHTIILGMTTGTASSRAEYESLMSNEFGRYFINLREYLSAYGLSDAGLTPTSADTTAMSKGEVPPQLLTDGVHYTTACKQVIGDYLYKRCCELNIF